MWITKAFLDGLFDRSIDRTLVQSHIGRKTNVRRWKRRIDSSVRRSGVSKSVFVCGHPSQGSLMLMIYDDVFKTVESTKRGPNVETLRYARERKSHCDIVVGTAPSALYWCVRVMIDRRSDELGNGRKYAWPSGGDDQEMMIR